MDSVDLPKAQWMDEELEMLESACQRFYEEECAPHYERFEDEGSFDREVWEKAGETGLLGAEVPEAYGGPGGSFAHDAVITYQATRMGIDGWGAPLHNAIVIPYLLEYASEEQKQAWLPKLVSGEYIGAIAMTEPAAGSDLQGVKTTARKDGNHYVINGQKTFIHSLLNAEIAG